MDFDKLKKLVHKVGSVVLFDGNKPELIVLPFDKVNGDLFDGGNGGNAEGGNSEEIEKLNSEILALREALSEKEREIQPYDAE